MTDRGARATPEDGAKGNTALAEASLLLAAFFVGTDFVSVKYALEGVAPLVLVPVRYAVAGLLLLAVLRAFDRQGAVGLGRRDLLVMAGLGLVGVAQHRP